jgi:hypothetical protein
MAISMEDMMIKPHSLGLSAAPRIKVHHRTGGGWTLLCRVANNKQHVASALRWFMLVMF